jgi:hypothetical protein
MKIDPERSITITLPFGMIEALKRAKPILSMFRDEGEVRSVIEIIDAIYAGALEYIREEEGEIEDYLGGSEDEGLLDIDESDDGEVTKH